jgi:hypothetical protein
MFLYGHVIEELILFLAREAGHEVTDCQREVELAGIKGHIDAIIDGKVMDVKSASSRSFDKFADGSLKDNDPFGYIKQIGFYKQGLVMDGGFLAMDKQFGHLTTYLPEEDVNVVPRIDELKYLAKEDTPEPVRLRAYDPVPYGKSGNYVLCTECKYCSHKLNCWADANDGKGLRAFMYSNGPIFFTKVVHTPKVDEVK